MSKKTKSKTAKAVEREREARIVDLQALVVDPWAKKKQVKRAQAELDTLLQIRGAFHPSTAPTAGRRSLDLVPAGRTIEELDALAARADAVKRRIDGASATPSALSSAALASGYDRRDDEDEVTYQWRKRQEREATEEWARARRTMIDPTPVDETSLASSMTIDDAPSSTGSPDTETPPAAATPTPAAGGLPFEVPEDPVLTDGNGRPRIYIEDPKAPGKAKLVAYTRVTTYIDCLEDKSMLDRWKTRTLLEGAGLEDRQHQDADEGSVAAVMRSMTRRDTALTDLDERERGGDLFTHLEREQAVKEHRDFTNRIVENLLDIGGAHAKADAGTRLHHLTELVDGGQPMPDWVTPSERLDVEAYQRAVASAELQVLWSERRVVDDELGTTGTMDRAYLAKLPGRQRRVRVVGDLKTGNVEWGAGKIGMQLAAYARGKGYRHDAEDFSREDLRLSRTDALLIHLPAGEHRCTIYLVDLTLAAKGLDLAAQVRAWRSQGRRVYDLKKPHVAVDTAAPTAS